MCVDQMINMCCSFNYIFYLTFKARHRLVKKSSKISFKKTKLFFIIDYYNIVRFGLHVFSKLITHIAYIYLSEKALCAALPRNEQ